MNSTNNRLRFELKPLFIDRIDAGKRLGEKLEKYRGNAVAFAVPRGGVPVAVQVAHALEIPLDFVATRKIPIPENPEAGYGAVTDDGSVIVNEPMVKQLGLTTREVRAQAAEVQTEISRRVALFRASLAPTPVAGKTAILIDDGLASGFTMLAAVKSMKKKDPEKIVVAVPVASKSACDRVKPQVDELVCLAEVYSPSFAVASFYQHWYDLTDEEVLHCLETWLKKLHPQYSPDLIGAS
ncbi:MAG: phosphoribosyltransferase family protein [Dehalococcoidales bacterium]|nr:phosphoribosyltransferase family protein [Dehalococcoidales bacterium]